MTRFFIIIAWQSYHYNCLTRFLPLLWNFCPQTPASALQAPVISFSTFEWRNSFSTFGWRNFYFQLLNGGIFFNFRMEEFLFSTFEWRNFLQLLNGGNNFSEFSIHWLSSGALQAPAISFFNFLMEFFLNFRIEEFFQLLNGGIFFNFRMGEVFSTFQWRNFFNFRIEEFCQLLNRGNFFNFQLFFNF